MLDRKNQNKKVYRQSDHWFLFADITKPLTLVQSVRTSNGENLGLPNDDVMIFIYVV